MTDAMIVGDPVGMTCAVQAEHHEDRGGICYTVRPGDSLWKIAERIYGDGSYWKRIRAANPARVSRKNNRILIGTALELPLIRITTIGGTCEPCPDPDPVVVDGASAPEPPVFWEAAQLLFPALVLDVDMWKIVFDTPLATVEIKLSFEAKVAKRGSVVAPHVSVGKDGISTSYSNVVQGLGTGFSFDIDRDGSILLKHDVLRWETDLVVALVSYVPPRTWKFAAGAKEPIQFEMGAGPGEAPYDVVFSLKGVEITVTAKDVEFATVPVPSQEFTSSWWSVNAANVALGAAGVAAVAAAALAAPAVITVVAGITAVEGVALAAGAAAGLLLFIDAKDEFGMYDEWSESGGET
ncbi:MAG: LysM peptidoglycan-binding domain-containing protein [Planctomycetes bacterium]|nr:LysM peptidoglycan-binding domain-containing protein [Planctomycetota bacterium]